MNKLIKILISLLTFTLVLSLNCYAGKADFTDDEAQKIRNEEVEKQQEIDKKSIGKSTNNFLKSLSVKGYTITPEFNKQVINYKINKEINESKVEILAEPDDSKAKVTGTGIINLQPGENEIKVDCEAENGQMKSYFITIKTPAGDNANANENKNETDSNGQLIDPIEDDIADETNNLTDLSNDKALSMNKVFTKKNIIIIVIVVIVIISVIWALIRRKNKKSGRHSK